VIRQAMISMALLSAAVCAAAQTQEPQQEQSSLTPAGYTDIVVTAPRQDVPYKEAPGATTVVGEDTLKDMPKGICIDEAVKVVPGVKVDTQYDSEKVHISIRGQGILTERGIRGIMVLLDGVPLNDPSGFAPDLYDVDWSTVERIEVIRGPSGAFYGGGSSGGVINIITKSGRSESDRGDLLMEAGANSFWKTLGEVSGKHDSMDYRISASREMGDGSRDHAAFAGTKIDGKFRFVASPAFHLDAILMGTSYFQENPEGLNKDQVRENPEQANPDSDSKNEYQKTRRFTAGLVGDWRAADDQDLHFSAYGRWWKYDEAFPSAVQHNDISNPGLMVQYTFHSGKGPVKNHFSLGADAGWQSIDQKKHPNLGYAVEGPELLADQNVSQHGYGFYALDRLEWGKGWGAFFNLRTDNIHNELDDHLRTGGVDLSGSRSFDKTTGRVGLTWNPKENLGFYTTWGQGFLPPATEELIANPVRQGGFNQVITPATSYGYELGMRGYRGSLFTYDAALFYMHTANDFERYRVPTRPLETFYGNAGNSRRYGLETSFGWYPAKEFTVRLAYTYNHFTYTQLDSKTFPTAVPGNWLPNSPAHQAYLDLEYDPLPSLFIGLSGDLQTKAYVDPANDPYVGGRTLVDARVGYRWKGMKTRGEVLVSLRNAFDKSYIAFTEPDPDGNSYQPGPGREAFVGIHLWFGKK
jgi:iron complex outermembrane receptor protein